MIGCDDEGVRGRTEGESAESSIADDDALQYQ